MSDTARQRIIQQQFTPRILTLWQALQPLKSCVSFMNTGAHPDDETSAMLAALSLRDGINISYACANRGEGGQNDIGSQTTFDLGVIRTAEMEQAADALNMKMYWLSESPEDTIFDFGFSKSGEETLGNWGYERTLQRLVEIIRDEKPDIICPTFLNIPGQHGHHRAMTQVAHDAISVAADTEYKNASEPAWQVKKMYLPAWSGSGDAYDDDLPPPPLTLLIEARGEDPVSGWTYEQIGQHSRRFHLTQGMGRWVSPGHERDWPLHLAFSHSQQKDESLSSALPANVAQIAEFVNAHGIAATLNNAQAEINNAQDAFPNFKQVRRAASKALAHIRKAQKECPESAKAEVQHRLHAKEEQLAIVIRQASRANARGWLASNQLRPDQSVPLHLESTQGDAESAEIQMILPSGWTHSAGHLNTGTSNYNHINYPTRYLPGSPTVPAMQLTLNVDGQTSTTTLPLESHLLLLPPRSVQILPEQVVLNSRNSNRIIKLELQNQYPTNAMVTLKLPVAWNSVRTTTGFDVQAPTDIEPGLYKISVLLDEQPAVIANVFSFPHIQQCMRTYPAKLNIRVLDVTVPPVKVAYVGGGNDRVAQWLFATGIDVTQLSDDDLNGDSPLKQFDTLVVGLFAIRTRPILQAIMPIIHQWVEQGGNLLTLYHRPWDDWNENTTPVKHLQIGKPSLRWRVTDENAAVTTLLPDHPLLNSPNKIDNTDWQGWHKERGLYFAEKWDKAYEAPLSMADPGEEPHHGALLSAVIGKGRHTHTSLILHHQMEKLVPGAFRIMANLVAGGR